MEKLTMVGTSAVVGSGRHASAWGDASVRARVRVAGGFVPVPTPAHDVAFPAVRAMV